MFKGFKHWFGSGLLVLGPLFLTILVIGYLFRLVDVFVVNPVFRILPIPFDATFQVYLTKFAIAVFVILFIGLIGMLAEKFFFRQVLHLGESILKSIPFFNRVYGSIQEIAKAFFGDKKGVFKKVVFVEYPRKGVYAMGFVTQDKPWELSDKTRQDVSTVFIPTPPNPATGYFVFVPKNEIIESDMTIEEGIKVVISGGAAIPNFKK